jgi:hypothetical protein
MTTSALFMGLLGLAASFLPQEILAAAGVPEESLPELAVILVQALGALYLGFAILNWMAKGILVGGIYARPLALGNFLHFSVVTVVLVKAIFGDGPSPTLLAFALPYTILATGFGIALFSNPLAATARPVTNSTASGSAPPESGSSTT